MSAPEESERKPAEPQPVDDAVPLAELLKGQQPPVPEIGGRRDGPEPTRYGDWEKNGRCIDF